MGMIAAAQGSLTDQVSAEMEKKVPAEYQDALQRVVAAGKKVMYSKETHQLMLDEMGDDPINGAGEGVVALIGMLMKESRNTIPAQVLMPSMVILLMDALDYVAQTEKREITGDEIGQAMQTMTAGLLQGMGVTPDKFGEMHSKADELLSDPKNHAAYKAHMESQGV